MQLNRSEVLSITGIGLGSIIVGSTWLWGPIPLIVIGVLLVVLMLFVDF
jgi:hypothetical protein